MPIWHILGQFWYADAIISLCEQWLIAGYMMQNALLQAPDVPTLDTPLLITLLPALPGAWPSGYIRNGRVRGGIMVDMAWSEGTLTEVIFSFAPGIRNRQVKVIYAGNVVDNFMAAEGPARILAL